jgi:hypothetical protein
VEPPPAGRNAYGSLALLVKLCFKRRAPAHATLEKVVKAHARSRLRSVLSPDSSYVNRIKLYRNTQARARVLRRREQLYGERRRTLIVCAARSRIIHGKLAIDAPTRADYREH